MKGKKLRIKPASQRLRQLIKEHGKWWTAISDVTEVPCFFGKAGIHIRSEDGQHERWVKKEHVLEVK